MPTQKHPLQFDPLFGRGFARLEAREPLTVESTERRNDGGEFLAMLGRQMHELTEKAESSADVLSRIDLWSRYSEAGLWAIAIPASGQITDDTPCYWSPRCGQLAGYTRATDFLPVWSSWSSLIHPADQAATHEAFMLHLHDRSGRTPFNAEYRLRLSVGGYRWFPSTGDSKRDETGKAICCGGSITYIHHERTQAEPTEHLDTPHRNEVRSLNASLAELTAAVRG
ncbi:MAG: hypothetical protein EXR86_01215 [Gammaproteobacteria bacterium]|nr:hypothetical protein [Gammaproteobacteria bacterium]